MKSIKRTPTVIALLLTAGLLGAMLAPRAQAADGLPLHLTVAKGSVDQVLQKITKMVAANGMMVMGENHQGKVLAMTGLKVKSESIFVGNPTVGKKLFTAERGAGQVVPVRINIYENTKGQTVVSYIAPSDLLASFNNPKVDKIGAMLDKKLSKMTSMLGK